MKAIKNILKTICLIASCGILAAAGLYVGYSYMVSKVTPAKPAVENNIIGASPNIVEAEAELPTSPLVLPTVPPITINSSTKIVYEYVYEGDGHVESAEEDAPYFLIGLTKEEAEKFFSGWTTDRFTADKVVMRKVMEGNSSRHYIIGILNGYVTVFYEKEINGTKVKEITDTPVNALSPDERQRLKEGISVVGDENLVKILEDYGS